MADYPSEDLGLPSGTLWAKYNVGANSPEEYGAFYAWGETSPKREYSWDSYRFGSAPSFSKYGKDGKTELELSDDAARANMGGMWHMPTKTQIEELFAHTTSAWTTFNDVTGVSFTSNVNGNSIFIPAAGCRSNTRMYDSRITFRVWSSSLYSLTHNYAWYFWGKHNGSRDDGGGNGQRFCGYSIRGVIG